MEKVSRRFSDGFLVVSLVAFLLTLFTGIDFSADFVWIFLASSIIMKESLDIQKNGRRVHSLLKLSLCGLIFVFSAFALLFG